MAANYVLLETITVGEAGASSVTFNNIPQTGYTDLKVVCSTRSSVAGGATWMNNDVYFNNTLATNSEKNLQGNGSSASSENGSTLIYSVATNGTANTFASSEIYIPNYSVNGIQKSASSESVTESNATGSVANMGASLWTTTSPITSIKLQPVSGGGSYLQYSTFYLYGLAAVGTTPVIAPYASGGDIIQTDGTYWYHAFLSSGTFTPVKALSCDYLVVAGGGGGGAGDTSGNYSGGGGAGGLRSTVTATGGGGSLESVLSLSTNTSYAITIGAGGVAGTSSINATNGANSSLIGGAVSITSIGGGNGGGITSVWYNPSSGGSGGGGSEASSTGASGTTNQGYGGGTANNGYPGNLGAGGGGGGAGVAGTSAPNNSTGGAGGNGVAISALATPTGTGVSNYYAGGGGGAGSSSGSSGGSGGGGNGAAGASTGGNATANTGSGGGSGYFAGKGGSGIVIVRYAI